MYKERKLERRLNTFIQVSRNITMNDNLTDLIKQIISDVIEAIDKADAGFFLLWNESERVLKIEAAVNFKEEMYLKSALLPGEGISGKVFKEGKSMLINKENEIQKAMSNMRNLTMEYYLKSTVHALMPVSCMSVPLVHQNEKIGVLTIDNFKNEGVFKEDDLRYLEAIASQIAISIVNARAFIENQQRTLQLEEVLNSYNQLNEVVLMGGGMQQLIDQLARMVQSDIYYFDPLFRLELVSTRSESDEILLHNWISEHSKLLNKTGKLEVITVNDLVCGHALAVQSSFGTVGYMVIGTSEQSLSIVTELVVNHAASVLGMEQMKFQERMKHQKEEKSTLLSELLKQHLTADVQTALKKFGILHAKKYLFVTALNRNVNMDDHYQVMRFEEVLNQAFEKQYYVITFPMGSEMIVLLGSKDSDDETQQSVKILAEKLLSLYDGLSLAVGRQVNSLHHVSISFKDAKFCNEQMKENTEERLVFFRDLGIKRFLLECSEEEAMYFIDDILGPILPKRSGREYNELLVTLEAFFKCNKNVCKTAVLLHLHQNTVYYRLQQLQGKLNCDFDDLQDLTNLQAALFFYKHQRMLK